MCSKLISWLAVHVLLRVTSKKTQRKVRKWQEQKWIEGRILYIQSYLVFCIAAIILVMAPTESKDKNWGELTFAFVILVAAVAYPLWMVVNCKRKKE